MLSSNVAEELMNRLFFSILGWKNISGPHSDVLVDFSFWMLTNHYFHFLCFVYYWCLTDVTPSSMIITFKQTKITLYNVCLLFPLAISRLRFHWFIYTSIGHVGSSLNNISIETHPMSHTPGPFCLVCMCVYIW